MQNKTVSQVLVALKQENTEEREQLVKAFPLLATAKPRRLTQIAYTLLDAQSIEEALRETPTRTKKQKEKRVEPLPFHQIPSDLFVRLQAHSATFPTETKKRGRKKKEQTNEPVVAKKRTVKRGMPVPFVHREEVLENVTAVAEESSEEWASLFD